MAKACTEDGCDRKHKARGLCATHYHGAARKAAPTVPVSCLKCGETFQVPATGYRRSTCPSCNRGRNGAHHYGVQIAEDGTVCGDPKLALSALRSDATVTDSGCWEWPKLDRKGYPRNITLATVGEPAHRAVLTAVLGRPLGAEAAHHTCANRACVNPDHLQPVTAAENTAEMLERRAYRARIAELEKQLAALAS